jgi:hypothetical protein
LASLMVASRNRRTGEHRLLIASPNPERFRQSVFQNFALGIKGLLGWGRNGDVSSLGKNRAKSLHWNGSRIRRFRWRSFVQPSWLSFEQLRTPFCQLRIPKKTVWRKRSSRVHSVNFTSQSTIGLTQTHRFISAAVNPGSRPRPLAGRYQMGSLSARAR